MKGNFLKITLGVLGTIILGAIGSGVWERFLSPLLDSATSSLASLFSFISKSYANSLYSDIGKGSTGIIGHFIIVPYLIIWTFILYYLISSSRLVMTKFKKVKARLESSNKEIPKTTLFPIQKKAIASNIAKDIKPVIYINYILIFSLSIVVLSRITKDAYTYDVVTYIEQSIEIITPNIPDSNFRQLKSQYRQIDTREKFQIFNKKISQIAAINNLTLPQISLLRIE